MELYAKYLREREGSDCIHTDKGFLSYSIKGSECHIKDIYVSRNARREGEASRMTDQVASIARRQKCTHLAGTVQVGTTGDTESLLSQLAYGFVLDSVQGNMLILIKKLEGE